MTLRTFIGDRETLATFEIVAWLKRRIASSPKPSRRHSTYTLMLQTIEHLAHERDLVTVPSYKIERLFARAKERTGWVRESPITKVPPSLNIPAGHKWCATCNRIKHMDLFKRQATAAERRVYNWKTPHTKVRWVYDNHCKACHENAVRRSRAAIRRRQAKDSVYTMLKAQLQRKIYASRRLAAKHSDAGFKAFYVEREWYLHRALAALEACVDDGRALSEDLKSDWTRLLTDDDRRQLHAMHQSLIEQRKPGRTPSM